MLKYIINFCLLFAFVNSYSQQQLSSKQQKDTIQYKTGYGLRIGIDISKPFIGLFDKSYRGLEVVGDYRISKSWYIASEVGYEKETTSEDFFNFTSKGSYVKIGANYNAYKNWLDMNNEIYVGLRYGLSVFDQTLNNYTPNVGNTYFPSANISTPRATSNLTAHWAEFQLGIKVETFKNLFVSFSGSFKVMASVNNPTNFKSLYAPGFNRIFESNTGFGFHYTISYLIPFVNK